MKEAKIVSEIKHDNINGLLGICEKPVSLMMKLCEFDFEPFNLDKKVISLDQFCLIWRKKIFLTVFLVLET